MITEEDINNRFDYHPPLDEETRLAHEQIRARAKQLAFEIVELTPESREQSLAITALEESMMWANAAIARNK